MHRFGESTLTTDLIKNILYNVWLPIYDTVKLYDYLIEGYLYIYKDQFIKCTKSGYLCSETHWETDIPLANRAIVEKIGKYKFGGKYRKGSDNFISNSSFYDNAMHERLGKYVRVYSDLTGIDLNPYYNLASQHYLESAMIESVIDPESDMKYRITDEFDRRHKVMIIPVRFNHKYTIALDCDTPVQIFPMMIAKERRLLFKDEETEEKIDFTQQYINDTDSVYNFSDMSFSRPEVVEFPCNTEYLEKTYYHYKNNLYMAIQVPQYNQSSAVVLDGDYTQQVPTVVIDALHLEDIPTIELNKVMFTKPSLIKFNTTENIPFSNILVQYLFNNVIDRTCELGATIETIQTLVPGTASFDFEKGLWDERLRYNIFQMMRNKPNLYDQWDLDGNVSREVERALLSSYSNGGNF